MILFKPTVQFWMCGWWIKNNLSPGMKEKRRNWEKRYSFIFFPFHHTSIPQIYIGSASTLLNSHSLITEFEKCLHQCTKNYPFILWIININCDYFADSAAYGHWSVGWSEKHKSWKMQQFKADSEPCHSTDFRTIFGIMIEWFVSCEIGQTYFTESGGSFGTQ